MKYWHVHFNSYTQKYEIKASNDLTPNVVHAIAMFYVFDMAYQYVTRMNGTSDVSAYSRWTAR